jgi:aspartyl-tRNA(Asn)/glutamyl-tRNA(Gln) amidotransferase subunit A
MENVAFSSLTELAQGLQNKTYSSVELTQFFLDRISRYDGKAHAFTAVYAQAALQQAQAADLQRSSGLLLSPLHGLPVAVKDICEINGRITTAGSQAWSERVSSVTATVIERLQAAGMILLGKTHMAEFSFCGWGVNPLMGTPCNPWSESAGPRAPGGSSSGSGVAVAAGLTPLAIGSDTGGSVRIPGAFNGLTALKPTYGRISVFGTVPLSGTLDSIGPIARTAQDAKLATQIMAGADSRDPRTQGQQPGAPDLMQTVSVRNLRVAVMPPSQYPVPVSDDVQSATENAIRTFRSLGMSVEYAQLPLDFTDLMMTQGIITSAEVYWQHSNYIENPDLAFGPSIRRRIIGGKTVTAQAYLTALVHRKNAMAQFNHWMQDYDLLLTPTVPFAAPLINDVDVESKSVMAFVRPVSYLNACAISLPSGFSKDGFPVGVQLIAKPWNEYVLIHAGQAFQQATEWHRKTPDHAACEGFFGRVKGPTL